MPSSLLLPFISPLNKNLKYLRERIYFLAIIFKLMILVWNRYYSSSVPFTCIQNIKLIYPHTVIVILFIGVCVGWDWFYECTHTCLLVDQLHLLSLQNQWERNNLCSKFICFQNQPVSGEEEHSSQYSHPVYKELSILNGRINKLNVAQLKSKLLR